MNLELFEISLGWAMYHLARSGGQSNIWHKKGIGLLPQVGTRAISWCVEKAQRFSQDVQVERERAIDTLSPCYPRVKAYELIF